MAILELENISKRYGKLTALEPMNLSFDAEKTYVLLGTSGCGKSTILKLAIRLLLPHSFHENRWRTTVTSRLYKRYCKHMQPWVDVSGYSMAYEMEYHTRRDSFRRKQKKSSCSVSKGYLFSSDDSGHGVASLQELEDRVSQTAASLPRK